MTKELSPYTQYVIEEWIKSFYFSKGKVRKQALYLVWLNQHHNTDLIFMNVVENNQIMQALFQAFSQKHTDLRGYDTLNGMMRLQEEIKSAQNYAKHYLSIFDLHAMTQINLSFLPEPE